MALSIYRQIVDALVERLRGIVGDGGATYWHTPSAVYAVSWPGEQQLLTDKDVLYLLAPDVEEKEQLTFSASGSGYIQGIARLDLAVLKRFKRPGENPRSPMETRWETQDKLVRDAEKRIHGDYTVGSLALTTRIPVIDRSAEETYDPQWVCAFLRLEVQYTHTEATP